MYKFEQDRGAGILRIKISGFWDREMMDRFSADEQAQVRELGFPDGGHLILCDVSESPIQPQEIVSSFQQLVVNAHAKARRIALFTNSTLSRMQAKRILVREDVAVFDDEALAKDWLMSGAIVPAVLETPSAPASSVRW